MHELTGGRTLPHYPLPGILAGLGGWSRCETKPKTRNGHNHKQFTKQGTRQLRNGRMSGGFKVSQNYELSWGIARSY